MQWTGVNNLCGVFYALNQIKVKREKEYFSRQTVKVIIKKNQKTSVFTGDPRSSESGRAYRGPR